MLSSTARYMYGCLTGVIIGLSLGALLSSSAAPLHQQKPARVFAHSDTGIVSLSNGASLTINPADGKSAVLTREGASYIYEPQQARISFLTNEGTSGEMQLIPSPSRQHALQIKVKLTRADAKEMKLVITSTRKGTTLEAANSSMKKRFFIP